MGAGYKFNLDMLRKRVVMHRLSGKGVSNEDIAERLGLEVKTVYRFLRMVKPNLRVAASTWWTENAACKDMDSSVFFPDAVGPKATVVKREAKKVCAGCPVRQRCLTAALDNYEMWGIWGGEDFSKRSYHFDERTGEVVATVKRKDRKPGEQNQKVS